MTKILIAEDNAVNRELLRELLEIRGYAVEEACDGEEALRMIERAQPDLLRLHIAMPLLDGFCVLFKIREYPRLASLPAVPVTTYSMLLTREQTSTLKLEADLIKPVSAA